MDWPGSPGARDVAVWDVLRTELAHHIAPARIVDAGGGTGGFAVPLAELGHRVTVVDPSLDSLATLARRAAEVEVSGRITPVQGDLDTLLDTVGPASADLVLCHSVLEVVDDPARALRALAAVLATGGAASVVVANRVGVVFARAVAGHLADAAHVLADPDGRWGPGDPARRRFSLEEVSALLTEAPLEVEAVHGVRIFADLVPGDLLDGEPGTLAALTELERATYRMPAYRGVAAQLHLLARRR